MKRSIFSPIPFSAANLAVAILLVGWPEPAPSAPQPPPGLYVQNHALMKDGQPYRGIGANYFSLFSRLLTNPNDTSSLSNLSALAQARIPFVRFMCGGFWPVGQQLYVTNRETYFRRLDQVVHCAETNGIGLIPSLFWNFSTVSDLAGEHLDELGNTNSKSIAFIRRYTEDMVRRYRASPALWAWEFGNEHDLECDLPNSIEHRPPVWPTLGTAQSRSERDELKFAQLRVAFVAFAETVRSLDPTRIIVSGNAGPRTSAWHNLHKKKWTTDTEDQFTEMLLLHNPDPMNLVTVHLYHDPKNVYAGGAKTIGEAIGLANRVAREAGKPLFLGEFGAQRLLGPREQQQAVFDEFLNAIVQHQVPLAAFWVFDYAGQEKQWNVDFHNDRAYMISFVAQANDRLRPARTR